MDEKEARRTERESRRRAAMAGRGEAILARYLMAEAYEEQRLEQAEAESDRTAHPTADPTAAGR